MEFFGHPVAIVHDDCLDPLGPRDVQSHRDRSFFVQFVRHGIAGLHLDFPVVRRDRHYMDLVFRIPHIAAFENEVLFGWLTGRAIIL